jgi:hypothetical protein
MVWSAVRTSPAMAIRSRLLSDSKFDVISYFNNLFCEVRLTTLEKASVGKATRPGEKNRGHDCDLNSVANRARVHEELTEFLPEE